MPVRASHDCQVGSPSRLARAHSTTLSKWMMLLFPLKVATSLRAEQALSSPLAWAAPRPSCFVISSFTLSYAESQGLMWGLLTPLAYFVCDLR